MKYLLPLLLVFMYACGDADRTDNSDNFENLEVWWEENTDSLQANTEQGWEEFKAEWKEQKAKVNRDDLDEEDQREYDRMEQEVNQRDQENQTRWQTARRDNTKVDADGMEVLLLGDSYDWNSITAANMKDTYIAFMEKVRANNDDWTEAEWNAADAVFTKLQNKKDEVDENMDATDEAKIAALVTEYRTLETAADVSDSASN